MTQQYVGSHIVTAGIKPGADGYYQVTQADGGVDHLSPAEFESTYIPIGQVAALPPYQQRVIAEHAQVVARFMTLQAFMATTVFATLSDFERYDMQDQLKAMADYAQALARRIQRFTTKGASA